MLESMRGSSLSEAEGMRRNTDVCIVLGPVNTTCLQHIGRDVEALYWRTSILAYY